MMLDDIVARKSYGYDIFFRIVDKSHSGIYLLHSVDFRLRATSLREDLVNIKKDTFLEFKQSFRGNLEKKIEALLQDRKEIYDENKFSIKAGKVLHIDADREYLNICTKYYKMLNIPIVGMQIEESNQASQIADLLKEYMPDILVITGHDSIKNGADIHNVENYKSSKYFIETVKMARLFNPSKDSLVIIAGACQSYYEGLIEAGANIASSPQRTLIHALDPLFVAEKVSYTNVNIVLSIDQLTKTTITGIDGIGGYETRGTCRKGNFI